MVLTGYTWSDNTITVTSTTTTSWTAWTAGTTATATTIAWTSWAGTGDASSATYRFSNVHDATNWDPAPAQIVHTPTPEEIEAARLDEEERQRISREMDRRHRQASRRALRLLYELIGAKAFLAFKKRKYHDIIAHSGKRYRLAVGQRVREMVGNFGDQALASYCIIPESGYGLPAEDVLVQQLLLLMAGEQGEALLLKTAIKGAA